MRRSEDSSLVEFFSWDGTPVVLLAGAETPRERREPFTALAGKLPDARMISLRGQRHAAHQTAPDLLASVLRAAIPELASARSVAP
jgi:hypothetical protein